MTTALDSNPDIVAVPETTALDGGTKVVLDPSLLMNDDYLNAMVAGKGWLPSERTRTLDRLKPSPSTVDPQEAITGKMGRLGQETVEKAGVASMSMSKPELLREVRRQKDQHRKQIRYTGGGEGVVTVPDQ